MEGTGANVTKTTIGDLIAEVKKAIDGCTAVYAPNTDLADPTVNYPTVSWTWPFDNTINPYIVDTKDTALGNAAADGNAAKLAIKVTTTVTQVD